MSGFADEKHTVNMEPPQEEAPVGKDPMHLFGIEPLDFPGSFFANPFAVSFPGDLPCPSGSVYEQPLQATWDMAVDLELPELSSAGNSTPEDVFANLDWSDLNVNQPAAQPPTQQHLVFTGVSNSQTPSPKATVNTPASINTQPTRITKSAQTSAYASQIQFVDMGDKKGAQRIRNTMNSRKHRQNKLDRIRELEKKLVELEAEKEKWRDRALKRT